ncbi:hypothetical protein [Streptomyces sp. NPDC014622]|uniref:hypothetical protein n=1 Tax=Streptomyces sp. NPDC014622 TaxID=3364874 RepID=UPI0037005FE4
MQIQRSKHTSGFTVLPNAILQHRKLSLTARGLLVLLLSLPEVTDATVKELTEGVDEGQKRVTNAMKELQAEGYVICTRVQNERGHWSTHVQVFDLPQFAEPEAETPKPGRPKRRLVGINPFGEKNQVKNPPTPKVPEVPAEVGQDQGAGEDAPQSNKEIGRAAAVLSRLGSAVPSLTLLANDVMTLAPLAAEWLERGVSELQLRNELVEGLPATIKSPRALLADRLTRKMPAVPVKAEPLAECPECNNYLPRGQKTGICGQCAGVAAAPAGAPAEVGQTSESASLLAAIRMRREAGTVKGSRRGFTTVTA